MSACAKRVMAMSARAKRVMAMRVIAKSRLREEQRQR
ncbi:MAG: hypothetical protein QOJ95_2088 [Mycobacterium sp.]|nr:hypothetical protein [Mycobacterium sp.]